MSMPNESSAALWQACLDVMAQEVPAQQFNTWLQPLQLQPRPEAEGLALAVGNRFKLDWIRAQYLQRLIEVAEQLAGQPVPIELVIAARAPAAAPRPTLSASRLAGISNGAAISHSTPAASAPEAQPAQEAAIPSPILLRPATDARSQARLDPRRTFSTLVEGSANRMARAAAMHVANAPGQLYNPLFIYGGVGLGKTHLLQAVGHQLLDNHPSARVLYTHAEQFVTDVVKSYQRKAFDEFKARYHQLDLLLIDDVQFFAGKEKTQEEFFNAFEALLSRKSHIVMTSDTYPKGLANITARLVSRFDSGLTVAIEPPELEMRVAILMNKAQAEGYALPEDVAFFVAKNVRANVRELEGALQNVLAYSRFSGRPIDIGLVREALRDLLSIKNRQISVENIQKVVADFYKIKVADMHSKKRPAHIAKPRQIAMYLAKEMTQKSLPEIGEMFGGRDHTTVLHAVRKIAAARLTDPDLNQQLHVLEQTLRG
ncbi:MAG: chromosomal replication initiator protein DnaA [Brachymonas sp.]|nr:chromosomal replication initiator protein DnaA [Brachymonas sp.]